MCCADQVNTADPGNTVQNTAKLEPVDSEEVDPAEFVVSAEVESVNKVRTYFKSVKLMINQE